MTAYKRSSDAIIDNDDVQEEPEAKNPRLNVAEAETHAVEISNDNPVTGVDSGVSTGAEGSRRAEGDCSADRGESADGMSYSERQEVSGEDRSEPIAQASTTTNDVEQQHTRRSRRRRLKRSDPVAEPTLGEPSEEASRKRSKHPKSHNPKKAKRSSRRRKADPEDNDQQIEERPTVVIEQPEQHLCAICLDTIEYKDGKCFGLMENCNHSYCYACLECWRRSGSYEPEFLRKCPVCKKSSWYNVPCTKYLMGMARDRYIIQYLIRHPEKNVFFPFILWDKKPTENQ